jgi:two-component system alkaline phosphatase synthesis response regulator PhoP
MSDVRKILVVDDEPDAIEFATAVLEDIGDITVESAGDGVRGFEKAKETRPDLIILDVQLPERSGFLAFMDIRQHESTSHIPVVMLTGISEKIGIKFSGADMEEFMGEGPDAFLEKPIDPAKLQETVRGLLGLED